MRTGKFLLILIIPFSFWKEARCQLAVFQDEDAIITPSFNKEVIHVKKISKIVMHYFIKPDGGFITDDNNEQQYFFDTAGKMTESKYTVKTGDGIDTLACKYYYDAFGNVITKRNDVGDFFDTWYYKWNSNNHVLKETHVHELSNITPEGSSRMVTQAVISLDSFSYISFPNQLQQYQYNEDKQYFRKTFTQYDNKKLLITRDCQYAVGSLYSHVELKYDSSGRITEYINTGNINGQVNQTTSMQYDSLGKVYEQVITAYGKPKHKIEYMYDSNGLASNKLDRDNDKSLISIIRFSYEVYAKKGDAITK